MLESITDWILSLNGEVALAIVFLVPALESSAFVGFVFQVESSCCWEACSRFKGASRSQQ